MGGLSNLTVNNELKPRGRSVGVLEVDNPWKQNTRSGCWTADRQRLAGCGESC